MAQIISTIPWQLPAASKNGGRHVHCHVADSGTMISKEVENLIHTNDTCGTGGGTCNVLIFCSILSDFLASFLGETLWLGDPDSICS